MASNRELREQAAKDATAALLAFTGAAALRANAEVEGANAEVEEYDEESEEAAPPCPAEVKVFDEDSEEEQKADDGLYLDDDAVATDEYQDKEYFGHDDHVSPCSEGSDAECAPEEGQSSSSTAMAPLVSKACPPKPKKPRQPAKEPQEKASLLAEDPLSLPSGYGQWEDWNHPDAIEWEANLAVAFGIPLAMRGPNPEHPRSPTHWKGIPFNYSKRKWEPVVRADIAPEYQAFTDWYSAEGLLEEARLARLYHVPWHLRGPPNGPIAPGGLWRGMVWRPQAEKWMKRGGANKEERAKKYSKHVT